MRGLFLAHTHTHTHTHTHSFDFFLWELAFGKFESFHYYGVSSGREGGWWKGRGSLFLKMLPPSLTHKHTLSHSPLVFTKKLLGHAKLVEKYLSPMHPR